MNTKKVIDNVLGYKSDMVKCVHCGLKFDANVYVDADQPEIAYNDPLSHGLCPRCLKPYYKK